MATDPALEALTDEQVLAAATPLPAVFLEAAPGSGKTTVAAQRFGALRYRPRYLPDGTPDHRAVLAVSFTRSATHELRQRVRQTWGPAALSWPHRICTLDTLVYDLLEDLLACGLVRWPGGATHLDVHDSWKVLVRHGFTKLEYGAEVSTSGDVRVAIVERHERKKANPEPIPMQVEIEQGRCTHSDVRRILLGSLVSRAEIQERVIATLSKTVGALIVDEVYDANGLDLGLIRAIVRSKAPVTLIGDPWQALYGWRGATPEKVPTLIVDLGLSTLPLSKSHRWRSAEQGELAAALRSSDPVTLPQRPDTDDLDVVLSHKWEDLWSAADTILPLAFGSTPSTTFEAALTLLLQRAVQAAFSVDATFLSDALTTLGLTDQAALVRLEPALDSLLTTLKAATTPAERRAIRAGLIDVVRSESERDFPGIHWSHTARLKLLATRLQGPGRLVPAMTVHQAKGREWDRVGIRLREEERAALSQGLNKDVEDHRRLYVACTRARYGTVEVTAAGSTTENRHAPHPSPPPR